MGTDIRGWVEVVDEQSDGYRQWVGVIKINWLVERDYGMFGNLFGQRNYAEFSPIAAGRGMPPDASEEVQYAALDRAVVNPSWILWSEIKVIDWEEEEGQEDTLDGSSFGRTVRRKDTLTPGWSTLWRLMGVLANQHGDTNVRLVVWFDS
jgi:hypothetical protein